MCPQYCQAYLRPWLLRYGAYLLLRDKAGNKRLLGFETLLQGAKYKTSTTFMSLVTIRNQTTDRLTQVVEDYHVGTRKMRNIGIPIFLQCTIYKQ